MSRLTLGLDRLLQAVTLVLLLALTVVVLLGIGFRYSGHSLIWYDELAAMLLAWITFTGAALAMLRNAHMGFSGLLYGLPQPVRTVAFWLVESLVLIILGITLWAGWAILAVFGQESLTSMPFLERRVVQAVLPLAAALMVLARLLTLGQRLDGMRVGLDPEQHEIEDEIRRAETEHAGAREAITTGRRS